MGNERQSAGDRKEADRKKKQEEMVQKELTSYNETCEKIGAVGQQMQLLQQHLQNLEQERIKKYGRVEFAAEIAGIPMPQVPGVVEVPDEVQVQVPAEENGHGNPSAIDGANELPLEDGD